MTQANDSITVTPGTGATVATQLAGGKEYQVVVVANQNGDMDPVQPVTDNGGSLTVDDGGSSLTVDGAVTVSGTVTANAGTGPWPVTDNGGSLTVDGTITANIGTTNGLALDATLTGGSQKSKIVDSGGTNVATVSAAGAIKVDGSAVTQPVSGTVTANVGTTNGLALDATLTGGTQKTKLVDTGGTNVASISAAGAVKVDGSAVTQPVSGTVTANAGTGPWPVTDNGGSLTVDGTVTANAGTGTFSVKGFTPAAADILCGSADIINTTTASTLVTVPAGRTWVGNVGVEASNTANAATTVTRAMIQVNGTGVTPAAGTNLCVAVTHPSGNTGASADANAPVVYVVAPGGNSVTIQVKMDTANANFASSGYANGVLL